MKRGVGTRTKLALTLVMALSLIAFPVVADAQEAPLEFEITGDATPGASVTVAVTTTDASTIQSVSWTQSAGVTAVLSGETSATLTVTLPELGAFKDELIHVLEEPPIGPDQLPPNVPVPEGEFHGGLQNRFTVVGINPFALEEAGIIKLDVDVTTDAGSYTATTDVAVSLPLKVTTGLNNVAINIPVLVHAKNQASYDWVLDAPDGSAAVLDDPSAADIWFTPDVPGTYALTVTDESTEAPLSIDVVAGNWRGIITGEDENGRPVADVVCATCHSSTVNEWKETGHAEIFTNNLNAGGHYSESCLSCHTVGYDTAAANNGMDDASDYQAFVDAGLFGVEDPTNWSTVLSQFPETARHANIQCENCHGPQNKTAELDDFGSGHMQGAEGPRVSLSSDVCASCHGEPLRHARFQQWQLSGHSNYELAMDEGTSSSCAPCHSGNGFLAWLEQDANPDASIFVSWTKDEVHPQTCQTCHDPHAEGTTTGSPDSDATVRISGNTPELKAGFTATNVGRGAICMVCHNSRRGLRNDATFADLSDPDRAPHAGPQADVLMGQNAFLVEVGHRSYHSRIEDACVTCHMEKTLPPDLLSYSQGGTNHTFYADPQICSDCHTLITAEDVQGPFVTKMAALKAQIEEALMGLIETQTAAGNTIDLNGEASIADVSDVSSIDLTESHGRQAMTVTMADTTVIGPVRMGDVSVVPPGGDPVSLYSVADPIIPKTGWNYLLLESDGSEGVHNPDFVNQIQIASKAAMDVYLRTGGGDGGGTGSDDTGGLGAVSCTTPYVYWAEIAAHNNGAGGSIWRTDIVTRNTGSGSADLHFVLHADSGDISYDGQVAAGAQGVFEDIVGLMGATTKGALEICSDQPLEVVGRIFNKSENGTFGQFVNGAAAGALGEGATARLLGLRQESGAFRTNINLTNASSESTAEVEVTLFSTEGVQLADYQLSVPSGSSVQDLQPFASRASAPDLGWGFATVKMLSGQGVLASASVIDTITGDATTIPMKR